jgi:E3 ubiquitin-protein ligase BAH
MALEPGSFMAGNMAKNMCAEVASGVISLVPRLDDYLCPICFSIAYMPVRLKCSHYFCVHCLVKMQREKKTACPLCRTSTVMEADQGKSNSTSYPVACMR